MADVVSRGRALKSGGAWEAVGFTVIVLAYIWLLRPRWWWVLGAVVGLAAGLAARSWEGRQTAGFGDRTWWWLLAGVVAAALAREPKRAVVYWAWCVVQQAAYQNLIYRRLREGCGAGGGTLLGAGVLFATVHLPNPVLAPATLLWGAASSWWFERRRNVPALALAQTLLSWVLLALTSREWHRNFRVGPGYFDWSSSQTAASFWARVFQP